MNITKRALDVSVALLALIVAAPVIAVAAAASRVSMGAGWLFRQERVGEGGEPFTIYKVRTLPDTGDTTWSLKDDKRVPRVGRFLRRTSLDELPQLVNVLKGDMSLVGPRPERPQYDAEFSDTVPGWDARKRVRPGLTGLAQTSGLRGDTSIVDRAECDNLYVDKQSLALDLKILARTPAATIKGE